MKIYGEKKNYSIFTFQMSDVLDIHEGVCPLAQENQRHLQISVDGVQEAKSNSVSLDVYTMKMRNCRNIYPLKIIRPLNKFQIAYKPHLQEVLNDIQNSECVLDHVVADNLKRAILKEVLNHCSNFACEFCFSKAVRYTHQDDKAIAEKKANQLKIKQYEKQIRSIRAEPCSTSKLAQNEEQIKVLSDMICQLKKKNTQLSKPHSHSVWPHTTSEGALRTREEILSIIDSLENEDRSQLTADDVKGIVGRSVLLDVPGFNFVEGVVPEYMHLACLGVVKRLLELTFSVGENRTRATSRRLSPPSLFNQLMMGIKVPREFPRRAREMDFAVLKAQEMRNIILFYFAIVVQSIEPEAKERRLWFLLAFMIRACTLPELEFQNVNQAELQSACKQFYILYEKLFTPKNCTYSIHVLVSHLLLIRSQGPFTSTSAFIFESFYSEMRNSFKTGTISALKQIMQRIYLKRSLSYHCCEKSTFYSEKDTAMESNSLIYTYENNTYKMYKIIKKDENNSKQLHCHVQGNIEIEFSDANDVDWKTVGVFKEGATGSDIVIISEENIHGKVLKVCSLLITCPINVLNEN